MKYLLKIQDNQLYNSELYETSPCKGFEMYLVTNNLQLPSSDFETLYKKRWSVEEYHKSLKQNMALSKSPTRTVATQCNHLFASLLAYVKMERLKFVHKLNHFSLKAKIYLAATKQAFLEYNKLKNFKPA